MKADPFAQLKLLDVQELDSQFDTLRHEARNPVQGPELAERARKREELSARAGDLQLQVDDLTREQRKADQDVEQVKTRRSRDQQRLDTGQGSAKDLEHLQHELVSLDRRISDLEDAELEVMERLEEAQQELAAVQEEIAENDHRDRAAHRRPRRPPRGAQGRGRRAQGAPRPAQRRPARGAAGAVRAAARAEGRGGRRGAARPSLRRLQPAAGQPAARRHRRDPVRRGAALRGVRPDPGPHLGVRPVTQRPPREVPPAVVIEADGGSRGNPGNAAYGAVLRDAATGEVIGERAARIGIATNNVAEYHGLIAGLELYAELTPGARVEARLDSKLVVEQMSGRWKIKHPDMKPLALRANRLAPAGIRYTWVPREQNKHADALANQALDGDEGELHGSTWGHPLASDPEAQTTLASEAAEEACGRGRPATASGRRPRGSRAGRRRWCWCATATPTTPRPAPSPGAPGRTPGSTSTAGPRSARWPSGCRRWPTRTTWSCSAHRCAAPGSRPTSSASSWGRRTRPWRRWSRPASAPGRA